MTALPERITLDAIERVLETLPPQHIIGDHKNSTSCTVASCLRILIDGDQNSPRPILCDYRVTDIDEASATIPVGNDDGVRELIYALDSAFWKDETEQFPKLVTVEQALATLRAVKKEQAQ